MKKTIIQILEQHQKIVNHFLTLQREMDEIGQNLVSLGLQIEDLRRDLNENIKNINLQHSDSVN